MREMCVMKNQFVRRLFVPMKGAEETPADSHGWEDKENVGFSVFGEVVFMAR